MTTPAVRVIRGHRGIYDGRTVNAIDRSLLVLKNEYMNLVGREWNANTIKTVQDIRREQDLLLDARLEIMGE